MLTLPGQLFRSLRFTMSSSVPLKKHELLEELCSIVEVQTGTAGSFSLVQQLQAAGVKNLGCLL